MFVHVFHDRPQRVALPWLNMGNDIDSTSPMGAVGLAWQETGYGAELQKKIVFTVYNSMPYVIFIYSMFCIFISFNLPACSLPIELWVS